MVSTIVVLINHCYDFQHIIPFAEDRDSGTNADIRNYSIISGNTDLFRLSLESSFLYLERLKPIDREEQVCIYFLVSYRWRFNLPFWQSRYDLNISAVDEGTPPRKGYLHIIVNVVDANDNQPRFTQKEYNFEVPENTTVGDKLFSVKAEDEDEVYVRYLMGFIDRTSIYLYYQL